MRGGCGSNRGTSDIGGIKGVFGYNGAEAHLEWEIWMILIIGGFAQGKLHYVEQNYVRREAGEEVPVLDGTLRAASDAETARAGDMDVRRQSGKQMTERQTVSSRVIINHLHRYIREQLRRGTDPETAIQNFRKEHPDCILICDEIGNGIVPMEAEERNYRERTGRILERLAAQADEVVRVVCGIGQKIK